jgi:excisionase family DNA binding protein
LTLYHEEEYNLSKNGDKAVTDELLTLKQVSEELQLHIETVRDYVRTKKLTAIKLSAREYRVRRSDLNKFLEERRTDTLNDP